MIGNLPKINSIAIKLATAMLVLMAWSCADENPNLVNPPPQSAFINIRFYNLAGDGMGRVLDLEGEYKTAEVPVRNISTSFNPPTDSSFLKVRANGIEEYSQLRRTRFIRNTIYTVFALPSSPSQLVQRNVDTIIVTSTVTGLKAEGNNSFIKLMNAYPDDSTYFTVTLGCQNGEPIATNVRYRGYTSPYEVRSGEIPISLLKVSRGTVEVVGLYSVNLAAQQQYMLVVHKGATDEPELMIVDEIDRTAQALRTAETIPDRETFIRPISFSSIALDIFKNSGEIVADRMRPKYIGDYTALSACLSSTKDTLITFFLGDTLSNSSTAFEVLEKYSVFVFDSAGKEGALTMIAGPVRTYTSLAGKSIVRVIHASEKRGSVNISLGARNYTFAKDDGNDSTNFASGENIAKGLTYGKISSPIIIPAGNAPITMFTATEPAQFLAGCLTQFEQGKDYILVITTEPDGSDGFTLIDHDEVNKDLESLELGSFVQFVNMVADANDVEINLNSIINGALITKLKGVTTVLSEGAYTFNINNLQIPFEVQLGKRNLIIATGTKADIKYNTFLYDPIPKSFSDYKRRFLNSTSDVPSFHVLLNSENGELADTLVDYSTMSIEKQITLERKLSYLFYNSADNSLIHQIDDILLTFGKNYTLILGGDSKNGYNVVIHQEF